MQLIKIFEDKTNRNLYKYIQPNLALAWKAVILGLLVSFFEVFSTALVLPLTQVLSNGEISQNTHSSGVTGHLLHVISLIPKERLLLVILFSLFCLTIIKNIFAYFAKVYTSDFMLKCGILLRQKCIERFLQLDLTFYTKITSGELLSYINEQALWCYRIFSLILEMIQGLLTISCLLWFMIILSAPLTLFTILFMAIVFVVFRSLNQILRLKSRQQSLAMESFSSLISEIVAGIRVVKSFNAESRELNHAEQALKHTYQVEFNLYKYQSTVFPLTETLGISVLLIILLIGTSFHGSSAGATLPILLTFTLALLRILPRINHVNTIRSDIAGLIGLFEAVQGFLSRTDDVGLPNGQHFYQGLHSEIVFDNLTFTFSSNLEATLKNVSFRAKKGTTTAIVGASGSGKSTLADLLMRFYDPDSGSITIDSINLQDLKISSWRQQIAIVSQDTFLFNISIRENIAYGRIDANELEIVEAAKKAYAYEFIQELPEGFDTIIGNRGTRLSGGQRQRIAIARAILCNPDILILDEATSALDSHSEKYVQKAIEEVSRDRTVFLITHRFSTIDKADKIIVLHEGRLVEQGTHQELMRNKGMYYSLYQSQFLPDTLLV